MKKISVSLAALVLIVGIGLPSTSAAIDLANKFVVGPDIGFTVDPDMFSGSLIGEYHVTSSVAFGPLLNFSGDSDDHFFFGTSGVAKYKANLSPTESPKLKPYGMVGVGFLIKNEKHHGDWDRKTEYLFPIGGGFEYWFQDNLAWGANVVFNISDEIYLGLYGGIRTCF